MLEVVDEPLETGRILAGKYRLERPLGEGGMGVVWAARMISSDRMIALKVLRGDRDRDPKHRQRFLREARASMAVTHPNVAKVHAVDETESGMPFIVMDMLEGESLRSHLRKKRTLTIEECARIFVPIVEAVQAAHALRIVHRDLKPENVFLVGGHDVRVLDFGIAKQLPKDDETASASLTSTGALLGTPHYMAPEQVFGDDDLDGRADVWALGIMLYEALAGTRPVDGVGLGPILKRITVEPIRPLHDVAPRVPLVVATLVDRMLSRTRDQRPSLVEVSNILERAARPVHSEAPPTRVEGKAKEEKAPPTVRMPPSTTMGVASKREAPAPNAASPGIRARSAVIGASMIATILAVSVLTIKRFATTRTPVVSSSSIATGLPGPSASTSASASTSTPEEVPAASASAVTTSSRVTAPNGGTAMEKDPQEHVARARSAHDKRDGVTCLRELDTFDRMVDNPDLHSTNVKTSLATMRARCLLYAGNCEGGRDVYQQIERRRTSEAEAQENADRRVAEYCASAQTPRDQLWRANVRLDEVADGKRRGTSAECLEWYDTVTKLSQSVPPRRDEFRPMRANLVKTAPTCLARAGDCNNAYRVFRDEIIRTRRAAPPEQDIRGEFDAFTQKLHACQTAP